MEINSRTNLRAEVESIVERLGRSLGKALGEELSRKVGREAAQGEFAELSGLAQDRFWTAALGSSLPFFGRSARYPANLCARLHGRLVEALKKQAVSCFAPNLASLKSVFSDVLVLDEARLDDIAYRLRLQGDDGPLVIPGRIAALYDVFRGFVARIWFEADADGPDPSTRPAAVECLEEGTLVLGDSRHAGAEMFERLGRVGAHGAFRVGPRSDLRPCGDPAKSRLNGFRIEDLEVEMGGPGRLIRLRAVNVTHGGRLQTVLTDVLDTAALPAQTVARLALPQWRIEKLFDDVSGVVDLRRFNSSDARAVEAQVYVAGLLSAALRAGQGWIAEGRGLPPQAIDSKFLFRNIAHVAAARARRKGESPGIAEPRQVTPIVDDPGVSVPPGAEDLVGGIQARRAPVDKRPAVRRLRPTPATRDEMMSISTIDLDPAFEPFCRGYAQVGHRDGFLWRWVQRGIELTTLPSVDEAVKAPNRTAKLLGVMLDVLLDDVADNLKDGGFLQALLKVPFSPPPAPPLDLSPDRCAYYRFVCKVWTEIRRLASTFPRFRELEDVLEFDYRQLLNTMRYAFVVNRIPEILNLTEHDLYQPHNMHMMISGTLDLMCSPGFELVELSLVRQALWRGQMMGRIGNMVSTWEREIKERDFTSGVFAAAIDRGLVAAPELPRMAPEALREAIESNCIVEHFLKEWERLRDEVYEIAARVSSIDLFAYARGLEELIRNHLGSRGLK